MRSVSTGRNGGTTGSRWKFRAALEHALGIVGPVREVRHLFLLRSTRIHLDEVEGLGSFVELETVIDRQSDDKALNELRTNADALRIDASDLVPLPYAELPGVTDGSL